MFSYPTYLFYLRLWVKNKFPANLLRCRAEMEMFSTRNEIRHNILKSDVFHTRRHVLNLLGNKNNHVNIGTKISNKYIQGVMLIFFCITVVYNFRLFFSDIFSEHFTLFKADYISCMKI